ncbi:MAG: preprotein translocase subunit SecE [Polyangiaceae bacterium]
MANEDDNKDLPEVADGTAPEGDLASVGGPLVKSDDVDAEDLPQDIAVHSLGHKRFVYAAYFGAAIAIAFLVSKFGGMAWYRLAQWKPAIGEPKEDLLLGISALVGAAVAFYYWRRQDVRTMAEEVAEELSKVTWPTQREVTNNTFIVVVTTAFATIFFTLMDRFWGFVTNIVYGS